MALFEREDQDYGADGTTRALSVTAVETDFVWKVYEKLATVYDLTFGPALHPGRIVAKERMQIRPGDRVLEVGIGTGINVSLYPRTCHVTGIDLSAEDAREGARARRQGRADQRRAPRDGRDASWRSRTTRSTSSTRRT